MTKIGGVSITPKRLAVGTVAVLGTVAVVGGVWWLGHKKGWWKKPSTQPPPHGDADKGGNKDKKGKVTGTVTGEPSSSSSSPALSPLSSTSTSPTSSPHEKTLPKRAKSAAPLLHSDNNNDADDGKGGAVTDKGGKDGGGCGKERKVKEKERAKAEEEETEEDESKRPSTPVVALTWSEKAATRDAVANWRKEAEIWALKDAYRKISSMFIVEEANDAVDVAMAALKVEKTKATAELITEMMKEEERLTRTVFKKVPKLEKKILKMLREHEADKEWKLTCRKWEHLTVPFRSVTSVNYVMTEVTAEMMSQKVDIKKSPAFETDREETDMYDPKAKLSLMLVDIRERVKKKVKEQLVGKNWGDALTLSKKQLVQGEATNNIMDREYVAFKAQALEKMKERLRGMRDVAFEAMRNAVKKK
jgi:hypothetical protein